MSFTFAGQQVPNNDAKWCEIPIAEDVDARQIAVPAFVINGGDGPTAWLQGCVHGNEYTGGYALREFALGLDPAEVTGRIVAVPVANVTAFASTRDMGEFNASPLDHRDLNRSFPGAPDGSFSEIAADALLAEASRADVAVDLHSGGNELVLDGFTLFTKTGDETETASRELCRATGLAHAIGMAPGALDGALMEVLASRGIPTIITETGGEGQLLDEYVQKAADVLSNVVRHVGLVDGDPTPATIPDFPDSLTTLPAHQGGFFEACVDVGATVAKGEVLAEITSLTGERKEVIESPHDAIVICKRVLGVARPGDPAFELVSR